MTDGRGVALITGATSGIGAEFARQLAARGYDLIITGRREEKIRRLADRIRSDNDNSIGVHVMIAELSDPEVRARLARKIGSIDDLRYLVNNAGFGTGRAGFLSDDLETHLDMIRVHIEATVEFTYAALPRMISRGEGAVINVSSVAARLVFPGSATYAPTKSYLNTFTEALHMELVGTGVKVQSLCPGFTRTDFHQRIGWDESRMQNRGIVRWMSAETVVDYSLRCLAKDRVVCIPGFWNRVIVMLMNGLPRRFYYRIAAGAVDDHSESGG